MNRKLFIFFFIFSFFAVGQNQSINSTTPKNNPKAVRTANKATTLVEYTKTVYEEAKNNKFPRQNDLFKRISAEIARLPSLSPRDRSLVSIYDLISLVSARVFIYKHDPAPVSRYINDINTATKNLKITITDEEIKKLVDSKIDFLASRDDPRVAEYHWWSLLQFTEIMARENEFTSKIWMNYVNSLIDLGEIDKAESAANQWLKWSKKSIERRISALNSLGDVAIAKGDLNLLASSSEKMNFLAEKSDLRLKIRKIQRAFYNGDYSTCAAEIAAVPKTLVDEKADTKNIINVFLARCYLYSKKNIEAEKLTLQNLELAKKTAEVKFLNLAYLMRIEYYFFTSNDTEAAKLCKELLHLNFGSLKFSQLQSMAICSSYTSDKQDGIEIKLLVKEGLRIVLYFDPKNEWTNVYLKYIDARINSSTLELLNSTKKSILQKYGKSSQLTIMAERL